MTRAANGPIVIAIAAFVMLCAWGAQAAPFAVMSQNGIRIVLTDEPCALAAVVNMKYRATWTERGVTTEGCYGLHPPGIVLFYFADLTVTAAPMGAFRRVLPI